MSASRWLCMGTFTLSFVSAISAETLCPGGGAGMRPRIVEHSIVIVAVTVNDSGPYDFVLDTAAQMTTIDPSLASELHLKMEGTAGVIGAGFFTRARYARLDVLRTGAQSVKEPLVLVQPLGQIEISDRRVRGILGENFLEQFDLLIDYDHAVVCLDDSKRLRPKVKGEHLALVAPQGAENHPAFLQPPLIAVTVAGASGRSLLLQLDSGINAPLLFDPAVLHSAPVSGEPLRSRGADGVSHLYAVLPPRDIRVGPHRLRHVSFVAPVATGKDLPRDGADGVLPTGLFRSVFISFQGRFAVLVPW